MYSVALRGCLYPGGSPLRKLYGMMEQTQVLVIEISKGANVNGDVHFETSSHQRRCWSIHEIYSLKQKISQKAAATNKTISNKG